MLGLAPLLQLGAGGGWRGGIPHPLRWVFKGGHLQTPARAPALRAERVGVGAGSACGDPAGWSREGGEQPGDAHAGWAQVGCK